MHVEGRRVVWGGEVYTCVCVCVCVKEVESVR